MFRQFLSAIVRESLYHLKLRTLRISVDFLSHLWFNLVLIREFMFNRAKSMPSTASQYKSGPAFSGSRQPAAWRFSMPSLTWTNLWEWASSSIPEKKDKCVRYDSFVRKSQRESGRNVVGGCSSLLQWTHWKLFILVCAMCRYCRWSAARKAYVSVRELLHSLLTWALHEETVGNPRAMAAVHQVK